MERKQIPEKSELYIAILSRQHTKHFERYCRDVAVTPNCYFGQTTKSPRSGGGVNIVPAVDSGVFCPISPKTFRRQLFIVTNSTKTR